MPFPAPLRPYHEHNAQRERPRVLAELAAGKSVALISDAGTPLVSDPGYKLVRDAVAAGHRVIALPGPSAPLAALASAGLPTDTFLFAGFLPPRSGARRTRLAELRAVRPRWCCSRRRRGWRRASPISPQCWDRARRPWHAS